jgi:hypothetical protein
MQHCYILIAWLARPPLHLLECRYFKGIRTGQHFGEGQFLILARDSHLKRLLADYVGYYHDDRTHLGLWKGTPAGRIRSVASGRILSHERIGGLHHRYDRAA